MKKSRHSEKEMVLSVKALESGIPAAEVPRTYSISKGTLYNWKSKYSGMEVSQVKKLKELEEEKIVEEHHISITRACDLMEIYRSYYYYKEKRDDTEVIDAIRSVAVYGEGFQKIYMRLRKQGKSWNHKKVYRVYKLIHYEKRSHKKEATYTSKTTSGDA